MRMVEMERWIDGGRSRIKTENGGIKNGGMRGEIEWEIGRDGRKEKANETKIDGRSG